MKLYQISPDNHPYLQILSTLAENPRKLYYIGNLPAERVPTVAIVGTRRPTPYGREVTYKLAYDLAKRGVVVVSGLALGCDAIAHRAALDAGGKTIAILANGLDQIYPAAHRGLAKEIIERGGALLSEYEPGTSPRKHQFLARNRLVSGLSDAVIVTEAGSRSGTLATITHALDQNREVFAVPGNITSSLSIGPNRLLLQGARPITSAEDVLQIIAPQLLKTQTSLPLGQTPLESTLIQLMQRGVRDGDQLQEQSGANAADYSLSMTMLELNSVVRPLGGNQWTLR